MKKGDISESTAVVLLAEVDTHIKISAEILSVEQISCFVTSMSSSAMHRESVVEEMGQILYQSCDMLSWYLLQHLSAAK